MAEVVNTQTAAPTPSAGSAGLKTQLGGQATTVDGLATATGGIGAGNLIEVDIDAELSKFESDDTPLCALMLNAKKVAVKSPIVEHYQMDEEISSVVTNKEVTKGFRQFIYFAA